MRLCVESVVYHFSVATVVRHGLRQFYCCSPISWCLSGGVPSWYLFKKRGTLSGLGASVTIPHIVGSVPTGPSLWWRNSLRCKVLTESLWVTASPPYYMLITPLGVYQHYPYIYRWNICLSTPLGGSGHLPLVHIRWTPKLKHWEINYRKINGMYRNDYY